MNWRYAHAAADTTKSPAQNKSPSGMDAESDVDQIIAHLLESGTTMIGNSYFFIRAQGNYASIYRTNLGYGRMYSLEVIDYLLVTGYLMMISIMHSGSQLRVRNPGILSYFRTY